MIRIPRRELGAVGLAALLLACSPSSPASGAARSPTQVRAEWPTYHGGYALDGRADAAPPDAPERLWKYKAEARVETTPIVAGGRVFFSTAKGALTALDLEGHQVWSTALVKESFSTPLLYADGRVIAGTSGGILRAFDAATGKESWKYEVEGSVQGTPNRVDLAGGKKGIIIISQGDGMIHAVDLETGKGAWKTEAIERCDGSAGVGAGSIVMGSCASALHVYSIEKASKTTDIPLGGDNQVAGGVAISGKTAFAGTRSGKVVAADLGEGKILWTNADSQREAFATPAVNDRFVVFSADDEKVYALKRESGEKVWEFEAKRKPLSPVIAGNRVVVSAGGTLSLLALETGKKVWDAAVGDEITSPAVVGGMILVGGDDGTVTAYGKK